MKVKLEGFEHIVPAKKAAFTMLYTTYQKHGVQGIVAESIYVADGFPLPTLTVGMTLDIDRDGKGYLVSIAEAKTSLKLN